MKHNLNVLFAFSFSFKQENQYTNFKDLYALMKNEAQTTSVIPNQHFLHLKLSSAGNRPGMR
jgi:hypothetical protein